MSQIVTWEQYSSLHSKVTQTDFDAAEAKAESEVKMVIGPIRWAAITTDTFGYEVLQECICKVIDTQTDNELAGIGKGVTSVSNDGYSESYAVTSAIGLQTELHASIRLWLSGTGLVGAY